MKTKEEYAFENVRMCPSCGSDDIHLKIWVYQGTFIFQCDACGLHPNMWSFTHGKALYSWNSLPGKALKAKVNG